MLNDVTWKGLKRVRDETGLMFILPSNLATQPDIQIADISSLESISKRLIGISSLMSNKIIVVAIYSSSFKYLKWIYLNDIDFFIESFCCLRISCGLDLASFWQLSVMVLALLSMEHFLPHFLLSHLLTLCGHSNPKKFESNSIPSLLTH